MFTVEQYRAKAMEYSNLVRITNNPNELSEFRRLERRYAQLADNAQWALDNYGNTLRGARCRDKQAPNVRLVGYIELRLIGLCA